MCPSRFLKVWLRIAWLMMSVPVGWTPMVYTCWICAGREICEWVAEKNGEGGKTRVDPFYIKSRAAWRSFRVRAFLLFFPLLRFPTIFVGTKFYLFSCRICWYRAASTFTVSTKDYLRRSTSQLGGVFSMPIEEPVIYSGLVLVSHWPWTYTEFWCTFSLFIHEPIFSQHHCLLLSLYSIQRTAVARCCHRLSVSYRTTPALDLIDCYITSLRLFMLRDGSRIRKTQIDFIFSGHSPTLKFLMDYGVSLFIVCDVAWNEVYPREVSNFLLREVFNIQR